LPNKKEHPNFRSGVITVAGFVVGDMGTGAGLEFAEFVLENWLCGERFPV